MVAGTSVCRLWQRLYLIPEPQGQGTLVERMGVGEADVFSGLRVGFVGFWRLGFAFARGALLRLGSDRFPLRFLIWGKDGGLDLPLDVIEDHACGFEAGSVCGIGALVMEASSTRAWAMLVCDSVNCE